MRRGLLIVLEGLDRTGKTSIAGRLVNKFNNVSNGNNAINENDVINGNTIINENTVNDENINKNAALNEPRVYGTRFPDRSTPIGQVLNAYLNHETSLNDFAVHLLYSANRWEVIDNLMKRLDEGQDVIVDRYAFSGVAFSAAKDELSMEWCKQSDVGLPEPDLVCFLDVSPCVASTRGSFGLERYENQNFQTKVRANYEKLFDPHYWTRVNTDHKTLDEVYGEVEKIVQKVLSDDVKREKPIKKLWINE